eukprot:scaffold171723_cov18-Tisochrysis_lutea.AAC.2
MSAKETLPALIKEKETLARETCEPPPPQGYRPGSANGDLESSWKHPAPRPGYEKYFCYQQLLHA